MQEVRRFGRAGREDYRRQEGSQDGPPKTGCCPGPTRETRLISRGHHWIKR